MRSVSGLIHFLFGKLRLDVLFNSTSGTPLFSLGNIHHDWSDLPFHTGNTCLSLRDSCVGQRFPLDRRDLLVLYNWIYMVSKERVSLLLNRFPLSTMFAVFLTIGTYQWIDHESVHQHFPNCSFLLAFETEYILTFGHFMSSINALNWPCNCFSMCFYGLEFVAKWQKEKKNSSVLLESSGCEFLSLDSPFKGKNCRRLKINSAFRLHSISNRQLLTFTC